MKQTPPGWPRISSALFYDDAASAIDFLARVFGFEVRLKVEGEGGRIEHSELTFGDGLVMVSSVKRDGGDWHDHCASPRSVNGTNTQALCLFVDDVDAHCAHSKRAGAQILSEPKTTDYGAEYWADRTYLARDPEGHLWWFMQRVR